MEDFVHLHIHTEYSLLDGASRIKKLVKKAKDLHMSALAITDHGVMYGVVDFYKEAVKQGIKPILGCEVYVAQRTRFDREPKLDDNPHHLVLLAKNLKGYQNLMTLVSAAYTEGFYYKPRVDKDLLVKHSEGIIALSACLAGEVAYCLHQNNYDKARIAAKEYNEIFGQDNFYIEIQNHYLQEQIQILPKLINLSKELGVPLVATNDVHYVDREDAQVQDVLLCIQTGKTIDDPDRMKFSSEEFYLKSRSEMELLFGEYKQALDNTVKIAEQCNVELSFGSLHLPNYQVPDGFDLDTYLRQLCYDKLPQRYQEVTEEITQRLDYELNIIKQMGYSGYFLIVWDFVNYAKENGILVGPGRGSAAGSIVAYILGITNIEPIKYNLLFERFLNPERVSMPDIDIDFCFERRGEVIDYVVQKYGEDKVSQIITFGTMAARAAVRDVGRVLNIPYGEVDKVAKLIPNELGITIDKALSQSGDLKELYEEDQRVKLLLDTASALEGMPRHASTHAAGVVISKEPIEKYAPLYKTNDGVITTQFAKEQVEEIGLLKMDFLGLRTLTVLQDARDNVKQNRGITIDLDSLELEDETTYNMLSQGEGIGVFQLESSGMRTIMKELKPESIEDIIALVALYRPGPLGSGMVDDFVRGKHGGQGVKSLHPKLEPILKDTYGVILYQEQVMKIASELAGFSLGEADLLRRAMGKKKPEVIAGLRSQFNEGAKNNGVDSDIAGQIFDLMEYFAGYGFNKSHSAAYAMVAYQTAFFKANYPVEYMAALMTSVMGNSDKVALYIEECKRMGIPVLPPDINESGEKFTVVGDKIRFGLAAVKNVGHGPIQAIMEGRIEQSYTSLADFCERVNISQINKRVIESLIKAGAFDSMDGHRGQLLAILDQAMDAAAKTQKDRAKGQLSLFDFGTVEQNFSVSIQLPDIPQLTKKELLAMEKEMVGIYISGHPLDEYRDFIMESGYSSIQSLVEVEDQKQVLIVGVVTNCRKIFTRKGEEMAFVQVADLTSSIELVIFPTIFSQSKQFIQEDAIVVVKGKVNQQDDETKLLADSILELEEVINNPCEDNVNCLWIRITSQEQKALILDTLKLSPGKIPVKLVLVDSNEKIVESLKKEFCVNLNGGFAQYLEKVIGKNNIAIR